jgi:hypothetical protein
MGSHNDGVTGPYGIFVKHKFAKIAKYGLQSLYCSIVLEPFLPPK